MDNHFLKMDMENERHEPNFLFRIMFLLGLCLFFVACATPKVKQFTYDPAADAAGELSKLQTEVSQAESEQIAVFAPKSYAEARKSLDEARRLEAQGEKNEKVLKELSRARSYFENAKTVAGKSMKALPEVADARDNALVAGAVRNNLPRLKSADQKLKDVTEDFERKTPDVSVDKRTSLQKEYLDIELSSIKSNRLAEAQALIESAKRRGAEEYAPKTLKSAEAKLRSADLTINTDRHNDALLTAVSAEVMTEAQRLSKVTDIARRSGRPGNEDMALQVVMRDERIAALREQAATSEAQRRRLAQERAARLGQFRSQSQAQLTEAQREAQEANRKLESQRRIEEVYRNAQQEFTPDEAQVYRQGDNLIIRMKKISFPTGRTEIPTASFETLGKVNKVINDLNAQKVIVEGHTDSTGGPAVNQRISEERAEAVTQFLQQQDETRLSGGAAGADGAKGQGGQVARAPEFEALGYGYEHPITSNKTKEGRAQNRRVDIVIIPEMAAQ